MGRKYQPDLDEKRTLSMTFRIKPTYRERLESLCKADERSITFELERAMDEYFKVRKV